MSLVDLSDCTINPESLELFSQTDVDYLESLFSPDSGFSSDLTFSPDQSSFPTSADGDMLNLDMHVDIDVPFSSESSDSPSYQSIPDESQRSYHFLRQELTEPETGPPNDSVVNKESSSLSSSSSPSSSLSSSSSLLSSSSSSLSSSSSSTASVCLMLPPCRVCGERASGFHYGVNTCEACKGFFRRSLLRKKDYKCRINNGNCVIGPGKRNSCPHCRHKKCLTVGMSKTAIKAGRYTHSKRTKYIQEIKRIEKGYVEQSSEIDSAVFQRKLLMALEESTRENPYFKSEFLEKLCESQEQYLVDYEHDEFINEVLGISGGFVTRSEYRELFKETGIDFDGRRQRLSLWILRFEKAIRKYIDFVKAIPSFQELPVEDQINLIKVARFDVWLISHCKGFHDEHYMFTTISGKTYHIDELAKLHDMEMLKCCFHLARRLKKFNLTRVEISLLQAIVIFFTDRCELKEPLAVESLLTRLVEVLQAKTAEFHPDQKGLFPKLMNFLCDLRVATDLQIENAKNVRLFVCDMDITIPGLLIEMCT